MSTDTQSGTNEAAAGGCSREGRPGEARVEAALAAGNLSDGQAGVIARR